MSNVGKHWKNLYGQQWTFLTHVSRLVVLRSGIELESSFARLGLAYQELGLDHPKIESMLARASKPVQSVPALSASVECVFSHGGIFI